MSTGASASEGAGAMLRPVREASLKAGARDRHDPEVKAAAAAKKAAAKKEKQAKKAVAEAAKATTKAEQRAKRADAMKRRRGRGVAKRLKAGTCGVRLRMRAVPPGEPDTWRKPLPMLRWFWLRNAEQRSEMRSTCWVWCPQAEKWRNPHEFFSPSAQLRGERHVPRCVFVGSVPPPPRWPAAAEEEAREARLSAVEEKLAWARLDWEAAGLKVPPPMEEEEAAAAVDQVDLADAVEDLVEWMVQTLEADERRRRPPPPPPTPVALPPMDAETRQRAEAVRQAVRARRKADQERARAAKVEEARRWDELVQAAMTGEVSSDAEEEETPARVAVRLHASSVMPGFAVLSCRAAAGDAPPLPACAKPPAAPWLADAAAACEKAAAEWKRETPLASALRQKAHWWKDEAGMSDEVLYKHLRDHNLEHAEACAEVARRRELIREGKGGEYAPPEMGRPVLGLLNGQPVPFPKADPVVNPWAAHLAQRVHGQA